jgi:sigma-B regulation protein RsbU (phosphoserine phosphatase)
MPDHNAAQPLGEAEPGSSTSPSLQTAKLPTAGTGTATTGLHTGVHTGLHTATIIQPGLASAPKVEAVQGWPLERLLLLTVTALVVVVVAALAVAYGYSTEREFEDISRTYTSRLQESARALGQTVSHTLSISSASSLRDNALSFIGEMARSIVTDNHNVLRVRVYAADQTPAADSDPKATPTPTDRKPVRAWGFAAYQGQPVIEYQEPIDYGSTQGKGLVVLTYSLQPLQEQIAQLAEAKAQTLRQTTVRTAAFGLGFVILAAILVFFLSRRITRPIDSLNQTVLRLAQGDLDARVRGNMGAAKEVKTLGLVFNHMADRISWLLEDVRAKAQLEREMSLARTVQETLLPSREPLQAGPLRIAGSVITADACGGDWWLRASLDDRRVVLGIGDVTGHGLSTALVATSATSGFAAALKMREPDQLDASMLASSLNQTLFLVGRGEYQMSSALAMFDARTGEIEYAAGAHPSPAVGNRHDGQTSQLMVRGSLLGASPGSQYTSRKTQLRKGDLIVWYTDGLTEQRDTSGNQYGMQRLLACIKKNVEMSAERLRDAILYDVRQFASGQPQADDITVVVGEYNPV